MHFLERFVNPIAKSRLRQCSRGFATAEFWKPKPGSGLRFCDSKALAPRSFNDTTVVSDTESQIASLTPVSSLCGSIKDDESIAAANENGIAMAFTGIRHFKH